MKPLVLQVCNSVMCLAFMILSGSSIVQAEPSADAPKWICQNHEIAAEASPGSQVSIKSTNVFVLDSGSLLIGVSHPGTEVIVETPNGIVAVHPGNAAVINNKDKVLKVANISRSNVGSADGIKIFLFDSNHRLNDKIETSDSKAIDQKLSSMSSFITSVDRDSRFIVSDHGVYSIALKSNDSAKQLLLTDLDHHMI